MSQTRMIVPGDADWPAGLAVMGVDEPIELFVRGDASLERLTAHSVAIVGARASTSYGETVACELAVELTGKGYSVVSDGGYGIATAAHRGALVADGPPTVAMLGAGLDSPFPKANASLFDTIVERGGLLVSLWADGELPSRAHFLARNRVMAAITNGTIVVEASTRSIALRVADQALDFNKPVLAVPQSIFSATSIGTNRMIAEGTAQLIVGAADVHARLTLSYGDGSSNGEVAARHRTEERVLEPYASTSRVEAYEPLAAARHNDVPLF